MSIWGAVAKIGKTALAGVGGGLIAEYGGKIMDTLGMDTFKGAMTGGGGGLPQLPGFLSGMGGGGGGGTPSAAAAPMMIPAGARDVGMGDRSIFRNDPNVIAALKPYAISMSNLRTYYRAPKGFVVVRDMQGDPMGIPKSIARAYGMWRPAAKPPISATDWKAFKRAASVSKKLNKIHSQGQRYLTRKSSSSRRKAVPANYTIVESGPGSVKVGGRK